MHEATQDSVESIPQQTQAQKCMWSIYSNIQNGRRKNTSICISLLYGQILIILMSIWWFWDMCHRLRYVLCPFDDYFSVYYESVSNFDVLQRTK